jgi:hypothetical protein
LTRADHTACAAAEFSRRTQVDAIWYQHSILILLKKSEECFDRLSMNGNNFNDFNGSTVRPEALEG